MDSIAGKGVKGMASAPPDITATLAHHDASIGALSGRITGVENGLKTLQGEVHHGFANVTSNVNHQIGSLATTITGLNSKLDKLDAAPKFDFHKVVSTVVALGVLFGMICGGIIYITQAQTAAVVAEQRAFNKTVAETLNRHDGQIAKLNDWRTTVIIPRGAR